MRKATNIQMFLLQLWSSKKMQETNEKKNSRLLILYPTKSGIWLEGYELGSLKIRIVEQNPIHPPRIKLSIFLLNDAHLQKQDIVKKMET